MSDSQGVKGPMKASKIRTLIVVATLALLCALLAIPMGSSAAVTTKASASKKFTILHTNDEHSEIYPYALAKDYPGNPTTGGFSRLGKKIADLKAAKASTGEPVLTIGAGDWAQGTLFSWLETGAGPELTLMQQMGYDVLTLGNHDVELGPQYLAAELTKAKGNGVNLPIVSSNIIFSGKPPNPASPDYALYTNFYSATEQHRSSLYIQPYVTKTLPNGLKVGMFGLMGVEAETVAPGEAPLKFGNVPGNNTASFINRVNVASNTVKALKTTENCDVVVLVSHMGTTEEETLATYVSGIDVIIGGHSHDLNYPPIIESPYNTIIVQAKANSEYLGDLELEYNPSAPAATNRVSVRNATCFHMDQTVGTVPALDGIINSYLTAINGHLGFDCLADFAETDIKKDGGFDLIDQPEFTETNLGDLIADTYKAAANAVDPTHPTLIAVESNGAIRTGLPKGASGVFSFYDLYRTLPLGGSPYDPTTPGYPLVAFYLKGGEITNVMEQLLALGLNDFFIQMSGIKAVYDTNAPTGHKVKSILVNMGAAGYQPLNPNGLYKMAANYYTGEFLSAFGLYPRDSSGAQHKPPTYPDPIKDFILHTGPTTELKCWQALTNAVQHFPDLDGDGLPNIPPAYYNNQGRITNLDSTYYFAEGTTRGGFETYITIQNPGSKDAAVQLTYIKGDGKSATQNIMVPASSRSTVHPADVIGTGDDVSHDFSTKVVCTNGQTIVAERPMYFFYNNAWAGGHDVVGATSLATTFYFAEGTCRANFDPYFCIENPNAEDAYLRFTYTKGDGTSQQQLLLVPKNSRYTERVKATLGEGDDAAHDFSTKVECFNSQPILVERPMYFDYKDMWTGGSDVVGATTPNSTWYFAEGTCRPGFDPYFCIDNTTSTDTNVEINYMKGDGTTKLQTVVVPKVSRYTVAVKDFLGVGDDAAHDFSASVVSTNNTPLVVERPVYCDYMGKWDGGHDVLGLNYPKTSYDFAEGTCRPGFDAYITIQNPGTRAADVKITYMTGTGAVKTQDIGVAANSRSTIHPADVLGTGDDAAHDFSANVECTNGRQIIVERPMYFNYLGDWTGASCVTGK
jgi:5'-nucleotidase / UDP-sugar diphosphatase